MNTKSDGPNVEPVTDDLDALREGFACRIKALGSPSHRQLERSAKDHGQTLSRAAIQRFMNGEKVEQSTVDRLDWILRILEYKGSADDPGVELTIVEHPDGTRTVTARGHNAADVDALLTKYARTRPAAD